MPLFSHEGHDRGKKYCKNVVHLTMDDKIAQKKLLNEFKYKTNLFKPFGSVKHSI